jgi:hypothetical protein
MSPGFTPSRPSLVDRPRWTSGRRNGSPAPARYPDSGSMDPFLDPLWTHQTGRAGLGVSLGWRAVAARRHLFVAHCRGGRLGLCVDARITVPCWFGRATTRVSHSRCRYVVRHVLEVRSCPFCTCGPGHRNESGRTRSVVLRITRTGEARVRSGPPGALRRTPPGRSCRPVAGCFGGGRGASGVAGVLRARPGVLRGRPGRLGGGRGASGVAGVLRDGRLVAGGPGVVGRRRGPGAGRLAAWWPDGPGVGAATGPRRGSGAGPVPGKPSHPPAPAP